MINLITFLTVLVAIVNFGVGLVVFLKAKMKYHRWSFFQLIIVLNGWLICNYISHVIRSHESALIFGDLTYLFGALIVPAFLLFIYHFPTVNFFSKKKYFFLSLPAVIIGMLAFARMYITDIRIVQSGFNIYVNAPQIWVYSVVVSIYVAIYLIILYQKIQKEKTTNRLRLQYIFSGFLIASAIGIFFDLVIPLFRKELAEGVYGSLGTIFISLTVGYAILRYRLLDITIVIRKSIVQFLTFVLLFAVYAYALLMVQRSTSSAFTLSSNTSLLATIFIIGLTIEPLRKGIYKVIDGIVANREKDKQAALQRMQLMVASTTKFQSLVERTQQELQNICAVPVQFLLAQRKVHALTAFPSGPMQVMLEDSIGQKLSGGKIFITDEIPYRIENGETSLQGVYGWMQEHNVSAIVPIGAGEDMVGVFLFLGLGQVVYTTDMVAFLKNFQEQSTLAFASAYAYKLAVERISQ